MIASAVVTTALGVGSSLAAAFVLYGISRVTGVVWSRPVRRFWKGFRDNAVVMTTEYAVETPEHTPGDVPFEQDQDVAVAATSGFFISYGMALGLTRLMWHFKTVLRTDVRVFGDKGHVHPREDRSLVVLGSPLNNRYLASFMGDFARDCPILSEFAWSLTESGVTLRLPTGEVLTPRIDGDESGIDWALVAHFPLDPATGARIIMLSGCNMWATEGATRFVTDRKSLRQLPRPARDPARPAAFVLRIRVSHGHCDRIELHSHEGRPVVIPLTHRRSLSEPLAVA